MIKIRADYKEIVIQTAIEMVRYGLYASMVVGLLILTN
jgi:hypothetical protein